VAENGIISVCLLFQVPATTTLAEDWWTNQVNAMEIQPLVWIDTRENAL